MRTSTDNGHFHHYNPDDDYTKPAGDPPHVHATTRANRQSKMSGAALSPLTLMRVDGHKHNLVSYADEVAAEQKARDAEKAANKGPEDMDGDVRVFRPVQE